MKLVEIVVVIDAGRRWTIMYEESNRLSQSYDKYMKFPG